MRRRVRRPVELRTLCQYKSYSRSPSDAYPTGLRNLEDRHAVAVRPLHLHVEFFVSDDKDDIDFIHGCKYSTWKGTRTRRDLYGLLKASMQALISLWRSSLLPDPEAKLEGISTIRPAVRPVFDCQYVWEVNTEKFNLQDPLDIFRLCSRRDSE